MPSILALDTSSDACSIALLKSDGTSDIQIEESTVLTPREHTQRLLPMIEALLSEQQVPLSALDAIAYGRGPGSFTGLRIGLSVAQGLAYGASLPLLAISSLQTMALTAMRLHKLAPGSVIITALAR